jgi:hypothetical protein
VTKSKNPKDLVKMGAPSSYLPEYCERLIEHARGGGSFESFAASIGRSSRTLYNWLEAYPDFLQARERGLDLLRAYYEDMGKAIATGQLQRVKSERPVLDKRGRPVLDPKTGQVLIEREFETVPGNASAYIWLTRNMLGWRNEVDLTLRLPAAGSPRPEDDGLTPKERFREIADAMRVVQELQQEIEEEGDVIDVSPAKPA